MNKNYVFYIFLLLSFNLLSENVIKLHFSKQPKWNKNLDYKDIERRLKNESVRKIKCIKHRPIKNDGTRKKIAELAERDVYLVQLESGLKGVFKMRKSKFAESAAYQASKFLGMHLVPPTVIREIKGVLGSFQFFIEPRVDDEKTEKYFEMLDDETKSNFTVFLFVFWGHDTKWANKLIQKVGDELNFALIDNARLFNLFKVRYGERPFVTWGSVNVDDSYVSESFPYHLEKIVTNDKEDYLNSKFEKTLRKDQLKKIRYYIKEFGKFQYLKWQNTLWVRRIDHDPVYTDYYVKSTLEAFERMSLKDLENIWADALKYSTSEEKKRYYKIMHDMLERKNDLLKKAWQSGVIVD